MSWKHIALKVCGSLVPDAYGTSACVLFPYAHMAGDFAPAHVRNLYEVPSIAKFKEDLDFLCTHYRPLRLSELETIPFLRDNKERNRSFLLSFDDGMKEVYEIVAPILRNKGVPAIFFLNSATIDNRHLMWRHKVSLLIEESRQQPGRVPPQLANRTGDGVQGKLAGLRYRDQHLLDEIAEFLEFSFDEYLARAKPYLTSSQILELAMDGFEFGAHSKSHPHFCDLALEEQKEQICASVESIRNFGIPCRSFAFPFHDHGVPSSVYNYLKELGIQVAFGTSEGRRDPIPFSFQRFALDGGNCKVSLDELLRQLSAKVFLRRLTRTELVTKW